MSGNLTGHARTLPFTGLASAPLAVVGLVLSVVGFALALVRPKRNLA